MLKPGPDPDFPYLDSTMHFQFPDPKEWKDDIISVGGNLSPGLLLSAYEQGIFPWFGPEDPIVWQSPDPRCVIFPDKLHVSDSMKKIFRNEVFKITFDEDFEGVIRGCSEIVRRNQNGTWITEDIIFAYKELHRLGWAHSAEAWQDGELAGGCYGVLLGRGFCGESMFAKRKNASKAAFLSLAKTMFDHGVGFVDCQVPSKHLISLGGEEMPRKEFLRLLRLFRVFRY
ncbi:MAG: leucyl/phenylalanyl-tRNA--protein transferase [Treponema sp.]|nr:leucyl/phenylalanyl-tRNA--protein transferase [Treponema sp.]MCL2237621.1 leucyl/phenylalanyl-tRNA--protein transferase [Treponema sp.]